MIDRTALDHGHTADPCSCCSSGLGSASPHHTESHPLGRLILDLRRHTKNHTGPYYRTSPCKYCNRPCRKTVVLYSLAREGVWAGRRRSPCVVWCDAVYGAMAESRCCLDGRRRCCGGGLPCSSRGILGRVELERGVVSAGCSLCWSERRSRSTAERL